MKRALIAFVFIFALIAGQAQMSDLGQIVQLCTDLPELQPHFPVNPDGSFKPVYVMHRDVVLPSDIGVKKFGHPLILLDRKQIVDNQVNTFLMFHVLEQAGNRATVKFGFVYGSPEQPRLMNIEVSAQKRGDSWIIDKTTIEQ